MGDSSAEGPAQKGKATSSGHPAWLITSYHTVPPVRLTDAGALLALSLRGGRARAAHPGQGKAAQGGRPLPCRNRLGVIGDACYYTAQGIHAPGPFGGAGASSARAPCLRSLLERGR